METNSFEDTLGNYIKKCNNFFAPFRSEIADGIPDFLLELLLDIYCERKAFYQISRNKLFENVEGIISSKSTLNKNYKYFKDDLKYSPNFNNYTFDFLYNSYIEETKNGIAADKLYTYNDCVLGIIIGNWKYMPFNPRNLSPTGRLGNKNIPADRYNIFFELNQLNNKNLSNNFDKLVYMHLTDHYFNINLLCQYIYFSSDWGIRKDYEKKLHDFVFAISAIVISALCELPSWHLKQFFWNNFEQNFKSFISENIEDISKAFPEFLEKTATDIYNFSLVYYPMYKLLFESQLRTQLKVDDEGLLSSIKSFISPDAGKLVSAYPDYSIEFMENIKSIDEYLLTILAKDFYSMYKEKFSISDKELTITDKESAISTSPILINNYYQKVNEIVRYRIRKIRMNIYN